MSTTSSRPSSRTRSTTSATWVTGWTSCPRCRSRRAVGSQTQPPSQAPGTRTKVAMSVVPSAGQALATKDLAGDLVQWHSGRAGVGAQQLEGGLLVQLAALHHHPLGLLDEDPVVEGVLELGRRPSLDMGPHRGAEQRV